MPLDPQRVRFKGKAISAAHMCGGSVDGEGAAPFVEALYSEWLASGESLESASSWIAGRLGQEFQAVAERPVWVEEEPAWPFLNGKPMTFISQSRVGPVSPGEVAYLFASRLAVGSGFKVTYQVVSQFER